ncbi:hypothetical protein ACWCPF_38040 [Streptomyces sp. NPDC001858]
MFGRLTGLLSLASSGESAHRPRTSPADVVVGIAENDDTGGGGDTGHTPQGGFRPRLPAHISRRHRPPPARTPQTHRRTPHTVLETTLLSGEPAELALFYRANAHKDLGRTDAALDGYRQVADADGRLAPRARRGPASLARIRGDFPTALAAVPTLGWTSRHHRVLGHIRWPHGDTGRAIAAFEDARAEAEQHDARGEQAIAQTLIALVTAFTDPDRTNDELALAHQLLARLDPRATTLLAHVAALVRDAGTDRDITSQVTVLRTEITVTGLPWLTPLLETALAFHHAVRQAEHDLAAAIDRLHDATANGDFAYYVPIAAAMGDRPRPDGPAIRWLGGDHTVRTRWRTLVTTRQHRLRSNQPPGSPSPA